MIFLDSGTSFECECRPGFTGLTCEVAIDDCSQDPCDPSGSVACLDLDNRFECECRDGYTGGDCSVETNECASR